MTATTISGVRGYRVWDSRGRPTVEAEVVLEAGARGRAIAPAGASRGSGEAVELRDGGTAFGGLGVGRAVSAVDGTVAPALAGLDATDQAAVDGALIALDGTPDKSRLGGNTMIAVSMAVANAAATAAGLPLWRWLAGDRAPTLPLPQIQIIGGGVHAGRRLDVQDFMVVAVGADDYEQALAWTAEVYRATGEIMAEAGRLAGVADEGGYWPLLDANEEGLSLLVRAIERAGLRPGHDMAIALDVAASVFGDGGRYRLARDGRVVDSDGMIALLTDWLARYPVVSIEDPLGEDDQAGLVRFTREAGDRIQVVGDDVLVTNAARVAAAAAAGVCNAALIKPDQAGTLTEARAALDAARAAGFGAIASARSGESEDATLVHLAVGWGVPQLKVGAFARSERMAKWNEGLRIARAGGGGGRLPPIGAFRWS
jgi:enolase